MSAPYLFLHSWSWVHAARKKGLPSAYSGRAYTIMAKPRPRLGEVGDGFCGALVPRGEALKLMEELVRLRRLGVEDAALLARYQGLLVASWRAELPRLAPGRLMAGGAPVEAGDVLACACSAADALAGRCHRSWASKVLVEVGWRVRQDGKEICDVGRS